MASVDVNGVAASWNIINRFAPCQLTEMVLITQSTRIRVRSATHRGDHILWNSSNRWRLGVVGEVAGDPLAIRLSPPVICPSSRALVFLSTPSASVFNPYHQISPPPRVDREGGGKSTWLEGSSSSRMVVEGICVATKLDL
ncbi:hypothetical protein PVAP13_J684801 [Panicum virgatum]|nr:hypothetical protein PVAP13_J684801 [Panicum virgatum]